MNIIVDLESSNLDDISGYDKKIFKNFVYYFKGNLNGLLDLNYNIKHFSEKQIFENFEGDLSKLSGEFIITAISDSNNFYYISNDLTGKTEIYYCCKDGKLIIGDNFFDMINSLEFLTISEENLNYFLDHGYCRPGKTYFKEIFRVPPGMILYLDNSKLNLKSYMDNYIGYSPDYPTFKNALNSVFESYVDKSKCHKVLFSGGIDSTVLLCDLVERELDVTAVTFLIKPEFNFNKLDVLRSKKFLEKQKISHDIIEVDFDNLQINDLLPLIKVMPFSSHLTLGFLESFKRVNNKHTTIWCGQNSDTLYNLGPTDQYSFIHRFLLSDVYIKMLNDVYGSRKYILLKKMSDFLIRSYYQLFYGCRYVTPDHVHELIENLLNSNQYLALSEFQKSFQESTDNLSNHYNYFSLEDSRKMLFDSKIGSFYTGGDNKAVHFAAELSKTHLVMPYSSSNMVFLFRNMTRGLKDILLPKKFLYEYANKELSVNKSIFNEKIILDKNLSTLYEFKDVMFDSRFGISVKNYLEDTIDYNFHNLNSILSLIWFKRTNELLKNKLEIRGHPDLFFKE